MIDLSEYELKEHDEDEYKGLRTAWFDLETEDGDILTVSKAEQGPILYFELEAESGDREDYYLRVDEIAGDVFTEFLTGDEPEEIPDSGSGGQLPWLNPTEDPRSLSLCFGVLICVAGGIISLPFGMDYLFLFFSLTALLLLFTLLGGVYFDEI